MATNGVVSRASLRQVPPPSRGGGGVNSIRSKPAGQKKSMAAIAALRASVDFDPDSERVRVAIRLRPKNADDLASETDFVDCIELQPELKRLKLRKNNWSSESYKFDEVFTENASQKRVYDTVAKPVVESVLNGCNGTVMAYGQTGSGKTYTVGRLGKEDPSERGIMVRAIEDILAEALPGVDTIAVSYLQLYLESIQDLLAPERSNISIAEDPRTGNVSLLGATVVEITGLYQFIKLLQTGEANRHAANTKLNTESSRSHAILMVYIQRSSQLKAEASLSASATSNDISCHNVPTLLKSKLLIVDLAGSERIDKSGSEGHMLEEAKFINLSLTSLGKCINALAENSAHIPTRDSKLTRLLRDSFGGTARTSLIITVGPSARHYSETASTIMFGQRAMKVVNNVKIKEELDYESICRKLQVQVDNLTSEIERQTKLRESEKTKLEKRLKECEISLAKAEHDLSFKSAHSERENACLELEVKNLVQELDQQKNQNRLKSDEIIHLKAHLKNKQDQLENSTYQKVLADTTQMYEKKIVELTKQLEYEQSRSAGLEKELVDNKNSLKVQQTVAEVLNSASKLNEEAARKIYSLEAANSELMSTKESLNEEIRAIHNKLLGEQRQMKCLEDEIAKLKLLVSDQDKNLSKDEYYIKPVSGLGQMNTYKSTKPKESLSSQKATTVAQIFEEVGLPNMFAMLRSENLNVQTHAAKAIANLAADDANQEKIVEAGGLDALLLLLETSKDTTIHRLTAGAIANLAMNGTNQGLIMSKGGACLLSKIAYLTNDPQTLRMVAGAIANLCGNEKLHEMLKDDGAIRALLTMVNHGHSEVIAQIARGIANFAKCESRAVREGRKRGRSLLLEEGVLSWLVGNSATYSNSTRRHIELALCHLAQNEDNGSDIILAQGVEQLVRISQESSKEDIRNLAKKVLDNPIFSSQLRML